MGNYIYKYVLNDEIIYIGKTKKLDSRIYQHSIEEKFKPHLKESAIFYFECANSVEMDLIERALINQYKPELNVVDKLEGFSGCITVKDLEWHKYEKQERQEKTEQKTKKRKETEFGRYERYDRMLHNKKVADVYRYIRKQMAIKNYMDCDNFDLPCSVDKENKVAIIFPHQFQTTYPLTFWFEKGGLNLPVGAVIDNDLTTCAYVLDKDFLSDPIVKEFEKAAKYYL